MVDDANNSVILQETSTGTWTSLKLCLCHVLAPRPCEGREFVIEPCSSVFDRGATGSTMHTWAGSSSRSHPWPVTNRKAVRQCSTLDNLSNGDVVVHSRATSGANDRSQGEFIDAHAVVLCRRQAGSASQNHVSVASASAPRCCSCDGAAVPLSPKRLARETRCCTNSATI